jgi:hypothetical protein
VPCLHLSHYRATKNEEAYRLYSLMDNVPMEYGKQQASLSGWENSAIFNIVSENKTILTGRYYLNLSLACGSVINACVILTRTRRWKRSPT